MLVLSTYIFQDSPSNKLLFAKDIPSYRKMVDRYFRDIHEMNPISDQDMSSYLAAVSRVCHNSYHIVSACFTNLTLWLSGRVLDLDWTGRYFEPH